jgi:hypothetical protein
MRGVDSFTAKVLQYELYFNSDVWRTRHKEFPGIVVIVWSAHQGEGEAENQRRIEKAERRLQQTIQHIRAQRKVDKLAWFFARLDQASTGQWRMLDKQGAVREAHLFSTKQGKEGQ